MKIHIFDVDRLSKHILGGFWPNMGVPKAENDLKMAPQNDPQNDQKKSQKNDAIFDRFWSPLDPYDAEIRWPPGAWRSVSPKPPSFRLRLEQQLQSLLASSKALSVIPLQIP